MWITSHVERLLAEEWDVCRITPDGDGDYAWSYGTAIGWVSVVDAGDRPLACPFAHLVTLTPC